jgi:hypothetical protein
MLLGDGSDRLSSHLIINIGNIHYKMNIIVEIIRHNSPQNVLGNIISISLSSGIQVHKIGQIYLA